jgi:hypothetical protein
MDKKEDKYELKVDSKYGKYMKLLIAALTALGLIGTGAHQAQIVVFIKMNLIHSYRNTVPFSGERSNYIIEHFKCKICKLLLAQEHIKQVSLILKQTQPV